MSLDVKQSENYAVLAASAEGQQTLYLPIISARMQFSVISAERPKLPQAKFVIAAGEALRFNNERSERPVSSVHSLQDLIGARTSLTLYLSGQGYRPPNQQWDSKKATVVWQGNMSNITLRYNADDPRFVISSDHWLSRLQSGSMITAHVKGAFADMLANVTDQWKSGTVKFSADSLAAELKRLGRRGSLWWDMIIPGMTALLVPESITVGKNKGKLAESNSYYKIMSRMKRKGCFSQAGKQFLSELSTENLGNLSAISMIAGTDSDARIKKNGEWTSVMGSGARSIWRSFSGYRNDAQDRQKIFMAVEESKLTFNNKEEIIVNELNLNNKVLDTDVLQQLAKSLANVLADRVGSYNSLEKLLTVLSQLNLVIVPNAISATVTPLTPVFIPHMTWRTIEPEEIIGGNQPSMPLTNAPGGVALFDPLQTMQMVDSNQTDVDDFPLGGMYVGNLDKEIMTLTTPGYLSLMKYAQGAEDKKSRTQESRELAEDYLNATTELMCSTAQYIYYHESLKSRAIVVRTPLRFDIAPASKLRIRAIDTDLQKYSKNEAADKLGVVQDVIIVIDNESTQAYSEYIVSHIRKPSSIPDDEIPRAHPMLDEGSSTWRGAPLVRFESADMEPQ